MQELIPYFPLGDIEQGISWVPEYRDLPSGMDAATINQFLSQQELLTVVEPAVSRDTGGLYVLHPPRRSNSGTFVARPTTPILSWR